MTVLEARRTTLADWEVLVKAKEVANVDDTYKIALQAWMNQQIKATKEVGKKIVPVYRTFKDFYDYTKSLDRALGIEETPNTSENKRAQLARIFNNVNQ